MVEIKLTRGLVAFVDDCDADLAQLSWYALNGRGFIYAARMAPDGHRRGKRKQLKLHMVIAQRAGLDVSKLIDHRNGDALDNRRHNLRDATSQQNNANRRATSANGFKGVCFHPRARKWVAAIWLNGKSVRIGAFDDIHVAADAYDRAAIVAHGEYARLNFENAGGRDG